jgi:uncharacterized OsmC-like protein
MERPMSYAVDARTVDASVSEASCKSVTVRFDSSPGVSPDLPGPAELLAMAFAACVLKNVSRYSEILPFSQQGASIQVTADRQQSPPRITRINYVLRLKTNEPEHRIEMLHKNIAKFGTIYNTLAEVCEVSGKIVAEPSH